MKKPTMFICVTPTLSKKQIIHTLRNKFTHLFKVNHFNLPLFENMNSYFIMLDTYNKEVGIKRITEFDTDKNKYGFRKYEAVLINGKVILKAKGLYGYGLNKGTTNSNFAIRNTLAANVYTKLADRLELYKINKKYNICNNICNRSNNKWFSPITVNKDIYGTATTNTLSNYSKINLKLLEQIVSINFLVSEEGVIATVTKTHNGKQFPKKFTNMSEFFGTYENYFNFSAIKEEIQRIKEENRFKAITYEILETGEYLSIFYESNNSCFNRKGKERVITQFFASIHNAMVIKITLGEFVYRGIYYFNYDGCTLVRLYGLDYDSHKTLGDAEFYKKLSKGVAESISKSEGCEVYYMEERASHSKKFKILSNGYYCDRTCQIMTKSHYLETPLPYLDNVQNIIIDCDDRIYLTSIKYENGFQSTFYELDELKQIDKKICNHELDDLSLIDTSELQNAWEYIYDYNDLNVGSDDEDEDYYYYEEDKY